jgi:hypothetical protein
MSGLGDGILADGVLGESSAAAGYIVSSPVAVTYSALTVAITTSTSINISTGVTSVTYTPQDATIDIVGNVLITPDTQTITYAAYGVTLDIVSVVDATVVVGTTNITYSVLEYFAGEDVAEGECFVTFSSRAPAITMTEKAPTITFQ